MSIHGSPSPSLPALCFGSLCIFAALCKNQVPLAPLGTGPVNSHFLSQHSLVSTALFPLIPPVKGAMLCTGGQYDRVQWTLLPIWAACRAGTGSQCGTEEGTAVASRAQASPFLAMQKPGTDVKPPAWKDSSLLVRNLFPFFCPHKCIQIHPNQSRPFALIPGRDSPFLLLYARLIQSMPLEV